MKYYGEAQSVTQKGSSLTAGKWSRSRLRAKQAFPSGVKSPALEHLQEPFKALWVHLNCSKNYRLEPHIYGFWYKNTARQRDGRGNISPSALFLVLPTSEGIRRQSWLRGVKSLCSPRGRCAGRVNKRYIPGHLGEMNKNGGRKVGFSLKLHCVRQRWPVLQGKEQI